MQENIIVFPEPPPGDKAEMPTLPVSLTPLGQQDAGATQPEAERPWNVPFGRNPFFTGRGPLLERLHAQLSRSQRAALTHPDRPPAA